jgi:hypothetical protein
MRRAPLMSAPMRNALVRSAPLRCVSLRFALLRYGCTPGFFFRHAFHAVPPCRKIARCSSLAIAPSAPQIAFGEPPCPARRSLLQ